MSKHTPGPWKVANQHIVNHEGEIIVTNGDYLLHEPTVINRSEGESRANAHRIVTCVNTCAGIDAPADLWKQRDELLAALCTIEDISQPLETADPDEATATECLTTIHGVACRAVTHNVEGTT